MLTDLLNEIQYSGFVKCSCNNGPGKHTEDCDLRVFHNLIGTLRMACSDMPCVILSVGDGSDKTVFGSYEAIKTLQTRLLKTEKQQAVTHDLVEKAIQEMNKAVAKYPQPNIVTLKIAEEAGEVVRESIHCAEGRGSYQNLRLEIIQTIAMLLRLWNEGDETIGLLPVKDQ